MASSSAVWTYESVYSLKGLGPSSLWMSPFWHVICLLARRKRRSFLEQGKSTILFLHLFLYGRVKWTDLALMSHLIFQSHSILMDNTPPLSFLRKHGGLYELCLLLFNLRLGNFYPEYVFERLVLVCQFCLNSWSAMDHACLIYVFASTKTSEGSYLF